MRVINFKTGNDEGGNIGRSIRPASGQNFTGIKSFSDQIKILSDQIKIFHNP
jgi:hypothetical protein